MYQEENFKLEMFDACAKFNIFQEKAEMIDSYLKLEHVYFDGKDIKIGILHWTDMFQRAC